MKHEALRFPRSAPKVPLTMHAPVSPPRSDPLKGILMMFGAGIMMSCMHATIRHVSTSGIHPFEIAFFRNVFSLLPLLPWFVHLGLAPLRTNRFGLMFWRALINTACMLGFFTAVSLAPLAEITALGFTAPIYVAILAIFFLDESIGLRRWSAIGVGFIGVFVVLRPGFETISLGHILVLATSFGWGICLVMIKILGRTESAVTITVYMSLMMIPMSIVPAAYVWVWPTLEQWMWLIALGTLGGLGQLGMAEALRLAPTHVIMPVDFMRLIAISAIAYLAFGEVPDIYVWIGGVMIFGATAFITYREHVKRQQAAAAPAPTPPAPGGTAP